MALGRTGIIRRVGEREDSNDDEETDCSSSRLLVTLVFDGCVLLQSHPNVMGTTALERSCVQSALGMLTDQVESDLHNTQRREILLTLLSDNDEMKAHH